MSISCVKRASVKSSNTVTISAVMAILPLSIAVVPWGVLTGALAIQAGFSALQTQCLSLLVFAGAAQLSGISMMSAGVPLMSILGSTLVISARHLLYSLVFRSHLDQANLIVRVAVSFVLTDEMFAVSQAHTKKTGQFSLKFALVAGFTFYVIWNVATLVGIIIGGQANNLHALGLDFAIAATFIAMTFDQLTNKPQLATIIISGATAVVLKPVFPDSYIILATLIGMISGYCLSEARLSQQGKI